MNKEAACSVFTEQAAFCYNRTFRYDAVLSVQIVAVAVLVAVIVAIVLVLLVILVILIVLFAVHGGASFRADEDCLVCMVENYASENKKDEPEDACSQRMSVYNVRPACAGGYADQEWNH